MGLCGSVRGVRVSAQGWVHAPLRPSGRAAPVCDCGDTTTQAAPATRSLPLVPDLSWVGPHLRVSGWQEAERAGE